MQKLYLFILTGILTLFIGVFPATAEDQYYIVKPGDCLWTIANANHLTVSELMQLNQLNTEKLSIGQKLKLYADTTAPAQGQQSDMNSEPTAQAIEYLIQPGDSLWNIAVNHRTTVDSIMNLNNLDTYVLNPGTKLLIKANDIDSNVSRSGNSVNGRRIINYAANFIGTPYRYGGTSPRGFDCSGFVQYIYKQFNISLPRTAAAQYQVGSKVDKANLQSGDLVYFKCGGSGGIDHVGIYTGGGSFIHSSSPTSGGVIYSSLNEGYYASKYVGARRILP